MVYGRFVYKYDCMAIRINNSPMTIPIRILELAVSGGWEAREDGGNAWYLENKGGYAIPHERIALDPLFWSALGKAKGWTTKRGSRGDFEIWMREGWQGR